MAKARFQADLDEPVELRIRGDYIDVVGMVAQLQNVIDTDQEWEAKDRGEKVGTDVIKQTNDLVNLGLLEREMKKAARNNAEGLEYRGIEVLLEEFDPRHPRPAGAGVERLPPLEDADWYLILMRTEEGYQAAGYPDKTGVDEKMLMASFLRQYARDLENVIGSEGDFD